MYRYYRKASGYLLIQNILKGQKKSICWLGLNGNLRQLLVVKPKKLSQNVNIMFRGGKEKQIVNFCQAQCGITAGQTKKTTVVSNFLIA